jgi:peptidylprolyl isomerase
MQNFLSNQNKHFLFLILILIHVCLLKPTQVFADLPTGNAVKDPNAILRNSLPIKQVELQEIQHKLEDTSDLVRGGRWPALSKTVTNTDLIRGESCFFKTYHIHKNVIS